MLFMAALCSRCGHHIFAVCFLFFPRLISAAVADWMSTILRHMMWPYSANLECMSENRRLSTIAQLCRTVSPQLKHVSTIGKTY